MNIEDIERLMIQFEKDMNQISKDKIRAAEKSLLGAKKIGGEKIFISGGEVLIGVNVKNYSKYSEIEDGEQFKVKMTKYKGELYVIALETNISIDVAKTSKVFRKHSPELFI